LSIKAEVIEDSVAAHGVRLTTVQARYHRFIHGELMTHRVFSRNAMSSRAVPIQRVIRQVRTDPAMPLHWGANQPGMQARSELQGLKLKLAKGTWRFAARVAARLAWALWKLGLHKQIVNRLLEPWQWMHTVISSTEWENFFELRTHPDAQPEMQALALAIQTAMAGSVPRRLKRGEWHLPFVREEERQKLSLEMQRRVSTARCARVSYLMHDGHATTVEKDQALHDKLVASTPRHASPAEHQAMAMKSSEFIRNFRGWRQYRDVLEKDAPKEELQQAA
jgi:hypothetical protein